MKPLKSLAWIMLWLAAAAACAHLWLGYPDGPFRLPAEVWALADAIFRPQSGEDQAALEFTVLFAVCALVLLALAAGVLIVRRFTRRHGSGQR